MPKHLELGHKIPDFKPIQLFNRQTLSTRSLLGKSNILVFCSEQEFIDWPVEVLNAFLWSCWFKVEGNIYFILFDAKDWTINLRPYADTFDADLKQYVIIGSSRKRDIEISFGFPKTPCVLELDELAIVRRIGFLKNKLGQQLSRHG